jgi:hypothetical protein
MGQDFRHLVVRSEIHRKLRRLAAETGTTMGAALDALLTPGIPAHEEMLKALKSLQVPDQKPARSRSAAAPAPIAARERVFPLQSICPLCGEGVTSEEAPRNFCFGCGDDVKMGLLAQTAFNGKQGVTWEEWDAECDRRLRAKEVGTLGAPRETEDERAQRTAAQRAADELAERVAREMGLTVLGRNEADAPAP